MSNLAEQYPEECCSCEFTRRSAPMLVGGRVRTTCKRAGEWKSVLLCDTCGYHEPRQPFRVRERESVPWWKRLLRRMGLWGAT